MTEPDNEPSYLASAVSLLFLIVAFAGLAVAVIGAVMFFPGRNG